MIDLAIYGNYVFDTIYTRGGVKQRFGGIANVERYTTVSSRIVRCTEGSAVVIDDGGSTKAVANLQEKVFTPTIVDAKWYHIAYVDCIPDIGFGAELNGIISADYAEKVEEIPEWVDYVFCSDEDWDWSIKRPARLKAMIIHSSTRVCVYLCNQGSMERADTWSSYMFEIKCRNDIEVLGAGDMLASFTISEMIKGGDLYESVKKAVENTRKTLEDRSAKN